MAMRGEAVGEVDSGTALVVSASTIEAMMKFGVEGLERVQETRGSLSFSWANKNKSHHGTSWHIMQSDQ